MQKVLMAILCIGLVACEAKEAKAAKAAFLATLRVGGQCANAWKIKNWANVFTLCSAAADQGNADAQYYLGQMYYQGKGVPQDDATAVIWYRKAADQGDADAQHSLGTIYSIRRGVPQDYVQAHMWFNLAAAGANNSTTRDGASEARDIMATVLTPAQLAEAQRLASAWRKK